MEGQMESKMRGMYDSRRHIFASRHAIDAVLGRGCSQDIFQFSSRCRFSLDDTGDFTISTRPTKNGLFERENLS
jgi:hypothetical protein